MKTIKLVEAAAWYGMTPARFEALLVKVGWVTDGRVSDEAVFIGYLTECREITPLGQGYLFEASRE
jgi:hypothetical protein